MAIDYPKYNIGFYAVGGSISILANAAYISDAMCVFWWNGRIPFIQELY